MLTILLGYVAGAINKWLYNFDAVFYLYLLNILFVFIDLGLYIRNSRQDKTTPHCGQKMLQCHS